MTDGSLLRALISKPWALARLSLVGFWLLFLGLLLGGCSSSEGPGWLANGSMPDADGSGGPCTPGTERACGVKISQANGVVACFEGRQYCADGTWTECLDGETTYRPDPTVDDFRGFFRGRMKPQAFLPPESTPVECDNPCDPYCYLFDEDPEDLSPPGGPTGLPHFPGGSGVQACEHDLCTTGGPLWSTCHDCVERVCDVRAECCTTAWSSSCVQLVHSLCAEQRPPLTLCELGVFAETGVLVANRSTSDAVIATYGDVSISTDGSIAGVFAKGNISFSSLNGATVNAPYGIVADGNITSQNSNSIINSFLEAGGSISIPGWKVQQHASATGTLTGQNGTSVLGDARANGGISGITVSGSSCGSAGCYTHKPVELPPQTAGSAIPHLETNCTGLTDFSSSGGTTTVPGPGVYRNVNVTNNGRVVLDGEGTYYFQSFQVTNRVEFRRTASNTGAGWDIRVCGTVSFGNGTQFVGTTAGGVSPALALDGTNGVLMDPSLVVLFADTSNTIQFGTDSYFTGLLIAPNAAVTKANMNSAPSLAEVTAGTRSAPVNGAIWARQVNLGTNALTKQIAREVCESLNIPGTTGSSSCPVPNVTPDVPPALNEPCASGLDCQINHRCVGPQTGAACAHSKCMPGAALSPSCDPCVERICDVDPSCCTGSWSSSCVAKVATVCDAVCEPHGCHVPNLCTAQSEPVDPSCDSCVASICAIDSSCCTTAWTQACADKVYTVCGSGLPTTPTNGLSLCDYAAYAHGAAAIMGSNVNQYAKVRGGSVGGNGLGSMNLSYTQIEGDVYNAGSVMTYYTYITGTLITGSGANAIFDPTTYTNHVTGNPPQPMRPTRTFSCPGGSAPSSGTINPGNYGNVSIPNGSTLTLKPGTYTFQSLTIGASNGSSGSRGTLALPSDGQVTINVCGAVTFENYARVTGLTSSTALNLDVYATGNIRLASNAVAYGVMSSNSDVRVESNATLYGFAWSGNTVNVLGNNATVDATGLKDSCKARHDPNYAPRRLDRMCAYSGYGRTGVTISGNTAIRGGDLGSGANLSVTDPSRFFTNVLAEGNVTKGSTSTYYQSLRARGTISGSATVLGTQTAGASQALVPTPSWPTVSFACSGGKPAGGTDQNLWSTTLSPGTYGNVTMAGDWQQLTLQAGDYYVGNFDLSRANTTLNLPASGAVRIFACGKVVFGNQLTLNNGGSGATTGKFQVYSLSAANGNTDPAIYVNNGANRFIAGLLVAPNGKISVGANSTLRGAAWGNALFTGSGATIDGSGWSGGSCEAAQLDDSPTCPVSVTAETPDEPAECVENSLGYTDSTCGGYDLAAGVPCGNVVPVCNHGTAPFNGSLTLGYWAAAKGQMSLEAPSQSPDGVCSGAGLSIAPGNCVDVPCALPSGTHTLVIDPDDTLNECGANAYDRRLDNWTVSDGRSCAGGSGTSSVEYLYEAECPYATSARWGFLTWDTEVPDDSTVRFSAKVGSSEFDISTKPYTTVGVAQASPVDTSHCGLVGASGLCPVRLSDALSLGPHQEQMLALKIELEGTTGRPVLKDWQVTYTCVYDE